MNNNGFITTELAGRIDHARADIIRIYKANGHDSEAEELMKELDRVAADKTIRVVFIGQYTAGKSTIISALTGNNEIVIDSNIATSQTSDYSWGGVVLTDTPGLYTENREHDERTIDMIKRSDLLIYCITSDLFNQYTLEDFEKWAFTLNYAGKMFLVINKMSKEDGTYDSLRENYSLSLNTSLHPHSVVEFPCSFVDAKDYRDGFREGNQELMAYSHFEDFIAALNRFVSQKGILGKLDTPIMIMKSSIDKVTQQVVEDNSQKSYTALLARIERKVDQQRNQLSIEARNIIRRELKPIIDKGYEVSRQLGVEDIDCTEDDITELIVSVCEKINKKLEALCNEAVERLNCEIEEVLNSDTASYFFKSISGSYSERKHLFETRETKVCRAQFDSIKGVIETATGKTIAMATKGGSNSAGFLIKATEASGSQLHTVVYNIGKQFGYKFKPWQAVNIAKNIGNVAKILGPVVSVIGLLVDVKDTVDEKQRAKSIQKAQLECRQEFIDVASDLEAQYSSELSGLFTVYDDITKQLQTSRDNVQNLINADNEMTRKLLDVRNELVAIQTSIF